MGDPAGITIWSGVAEQYDRYRPRMPAVIPDILTQLTRMPVPSLVVDLGSGTGLSTLAWAGRAQGVRGIEPNDEMRAQAERRAAMLPQPPGVTFSDGVSTDTGLPDGCADIVTISQAFHWMDPAPTLAEAARILRTGGVLAVYDYDWPPTVLPELETIYRDFVTRVVTIMRQRGLEAENPALRTWPKHHHLTQIRESGHFRVTKEIALHSVESGDAQRYIGLTVSNAAGILLHKGPLTGEEADVAGFRDAVHAAMSEARLPFYFSYHLRSGVK